MARPDGADYDPSAGEISWDGIREFIMQAGGSEWNRQNYSRIWWREEEERRLNFSEYLFVTALTPLAEAAMKAFGASLMVHGMDPIDPSTPVERLPNWSPVRYYQQ